MNTADLLGECTETRTRRSGPGGQHRNKVETAVILVHDPTGLSAEASERRSQRENRSMALKRLRLTLALEHRTTFGRLPTEPSPLWRSRLRDRRIVISPDHADYATLVAEALDHLQAVGWQMAPAARLLGVSTSQLTMLFRKARTAWAAINRLRVANGLSALR